VLLQGADDPRLFLGCVGFFDLGLGFALLGHLSPGLEPHAKSECARRKKNRAL
jgi:hypothetical protein